MSYARIVTTTGVHSDPATPIILPGATTCNLDDWDAIKVVTWRDIRIPYTSITLLEVLQGSPPPPWVS